MRSVGSGGNVFGGRLASILLSSSEASEANEGPNVERMRFSDSRTRETMRKSPTGFVVISRLWPRTRRAWIYVGAFATIFLVLDALALAGVGFAVGILFTLGGAVVGVLASYAVAYPLIKRLPRASVWRALWFFFGLASMFGIIFGGSAIAGIPLFPTAEGGNVGAFIYGAAVGFGGAVGSFARGGGSTAAFTGTRHDDEESRAVRRRFILAVCGAVATLLAVCLLGYLAVEYILSPIIRSLA